METDLRAYHQLYAGHFALRENRLRPGASSSTRPGNRTDERPERPATGPLTSAPWSLEAILAIHRAEVARTLGQPDGVLILDDVHSETSAPVPPKTGHTHRIAALAYVSRRGATLVDQRLYWLDPAGDQPEPCPPNEADAPAGHRLSADLITRVMSEGVLPFEWVLIGVDYRQALPLLNPIDQQSKLYLAAAPRWARAWRTRPKVVLPDRRVPVREMAGRLRLAPGQPEAQRLDALAVRLPAAVWRRCPSAHGPQGIEFAALRVVMAHDGLPGREEWLLAQRPHNELNLDRWSFHRSNAPADTPLEQLAQLASWRLWADSVLAVGQSGWHPEQPLGEGWPAWQRHSTLTSLAHHFLVRLRLKYGEAAPAMTVPQVHRLLRVIFARHEFDAQAASAEMRHIQEQNLIAYLSQSEAVAETA